VTFLLLSLACAPGALITSAALKKRCQAAAVGAAAQLQGCLLQITNFTSSAAIVCRSPVDDLLLVTLQPAKHVGPAAQVHGCLLQTTFCTSSAAIVFIMCLLPFTSRELASCDHYIIGSSNQPTLPCCCCLHVRAVNDHLQLSNTNGVKQQLWGLQLSCRAAYCKSPILQVLLLLFAVHQSMTYYW
jgi:hypothetical protein